jgi:hypothetical protein
MARPKAKAENTSPYIRLPRSSREQTSAYIRLPRSSRDQAPTVAPDQSAPDATDARSENSSRQS